MPASISLFEIHIAQNVRADAEPEGNLPGPDPSAIQQPSVFTIAEDEGIVGLSLNSECAGLRRTLPSDQANLEVRVVRQRLSAYLVLLAPHNRVLVNGVPTVGMSVLAAGDSLVPAPGYLCHVTERVRPYIGPPSAELLRKKCPFCMVPLTDKTRIIVCRCGAPYHHETAETHPDTTEDDRLRCFEKVRACLACGRAVAVEEYLVWDPRSL